VPSSRHLETSSQPYHPLTTAATAAVILAMPLACSANEKRDFPDDRLWESTHFRYHTRNSDEGACASVLDQLERHFELMQGYLGFPWPEGRKVDYFKFIDEADYQSNSDCPEESFSCTLASEVRSPSVLHEHELIHAYLAPLGRPPQFLVEGAAEALACSAPADTLSQPSQWQDVVALPRSDQFDARAYGQWFTGYLLYRYGPAPYLSLYHLLDGDSVSTQQFSATFESVYGETLDSVWNAALASSYRFRCFNRWKCSGPALLLDGSPQTVAKACDGSENERTFQLDETTDVLITIEGPVTVYAPVSCDEELPYPVSGDEFGNVLDTTIAQIAPGKYFMQADAYHATTFAVRTLQPNTFSLDCAQTELTQLSASDLPRGTFRVTIAADGRSWFVKMNRYVLWTGTGNDFEGWQGGVNVEECVNCSDTPTCQLIDYHGETHPDASGNVTLRLTAATPGPGYVTTRFLY
jgi:hypothetical protein